MKTLEQLYEEISANDELKKEYRKATGDKKIVDFLKAHDCDATQSELDAFISSKKNKELADDELDMVSGGGACTTYTSDGWPIVSALNHCKKYVFDYKDHGLEYVGSYCNVCKHSIDEGGLLVCHCPDRHESIDDV